MDILPTQVIEDDFMPTQKLSHSLPYVAMREKMQIGTLRIGSTTYPINQGVTQIGRHPECSIILMDQTVSKKHAEIEVNSGETWLCDMNSSNKTKLNSSVLRPGRYYQLKGGSVIEFGNVRAVYSELYSMDESLIPGTPAPSRLKAANTIIPGTPDTSINYSSTSESEISMIPGTQADKGDSVFRRPSVPPRSSVSSRKSYLPDSSIENSVNESTDSLSLPGKENLNAQKVSIHNMETQKSFESRNDSSTNIHDIETQEVCLESCNSQHPDNQTNMYDMETQHEDTSSQCNVTDIHNIETQHVDVDIYSLKTPRKTDVQNASVEGNENTSSVKAKQVKEVELKVDVSSMKACEGETNGVTESQKAIVEKDENSTHSEQSEISRKGSQEYLELSISTSNFDEECSELDGTRNILGSPNLLEDFVDDDSVNKSGPKSISHSNSLVNNNRMTEKCSNEENVFDAATQINVNTENIFEKVSQRVDDAFGASMEDDSDDTDQEGVFQRYSRVDSQDSSQGKSQIKRQSDSEDSNTDDEGRFTAMAAKEKEAVTMSLELRQNESKESKHNAESSGESDDLFDIPTQKVSLTNKNSSKEQGDISKDSVDFDTPTQVIETHKPENMAEKSNLDMDAPTQLIEVNEPVNNVVIEMHKPENMSEKSNLDMDAPTQLIEVNEPVSNVVIEMHKPENMSEKSNLDMDAPTQLIEVNEPVSNVVQKDTDDIDDLMPTQIIPSMEASTNVNLAKDNTKYSKEKEEDDAQYNTPTQIIPEVPIYNEPLPNDPDKLNPRLVDEFSIEDLDYEMAPTQLLTDIEEKKKATSTKNKRKSWKSKKVNLDDTLERNLNEMFDDVNEDIEDQPQISTQVLTNILQSSQSEEKSTDLNIDKETPRSNRKNMSTSRVRSKSPATKREVSPVLCRKSRRSSLRKATNHNDSQEYFSNLTSTRKRNILVDSQDSDSLSEEAADTKNQVKTESVNKIVNVENIAPAALLKSVSENSPLTRLSRTNKTEELNKFELVIETTDSPKSNKNAVEHSGKGDEISITSVDAGPSEHSVTTLESDDEDIMSGLPEVRISGTLSNPPSPASSTATEFKLCTRNTKPRSGAKKAETKKKGVRKKSTRKSVARVNVENNEKTSRSRTTAISGISDNFDVDEILMTIPESNENEINEIMPAKRMSLRKSLQADLNPPQEEVRRSPTIQGSGRTRVTNKKDVDSSSVFQVSKEILITKEAEPARKTAPRALRGVKRSLSSTGVTESTVVKKFKKDVNEKTSVATKGRKSNVRSVPTARSSSANILDYIMRKDSPVFNSDSSQQSLSSSQVNAENKQLKIMVTRLSSGTPTLPLSPSSGVDLATENGQTTISSAISTSSEEESGRSTTARTKRNNSRIAVSKRNMEDVSEQIGEESQEIEMITDSWVKGQGINVNVKNHGETNENAKTVRTRSTRKRGLKIASTSEEITEKSTSSEVFESDNPDFDVPISKAKRARFSRNTTNVDNVAANESTTRGRRNTATNNTGSKETTKRGRKKGKAQKVDTEEKSEASIPEETTSSEVNSSMDMSAMLTPTRSRRNMSTSFATSSPYKIKHKILFTGISNDYTKLLTKLGSSQVEDPTKCTVLVTDKVRRTVKFLCALAQAVPIVSVSWLVESEKAGHFAEWDNYVLKDPAAEAKFGFRLRGSLEKAKKQKLLDGYTVVLTPNVAPPLPELKSIINSCGGKPLVRPPTKWPEKAVIVTREEDIASAKKFLAKAPATVTIQSTEFILSGILRQELDFIKYKLT